MQPAWSIRRRLPLLVSLVVVGVAGLLCGASYETVRHHAEAAVADRLTRLATQVGASVDTTGSRLVLDSLRSVASAPEIARFLRGSGDEASARDALLRLVDDATGERGVTLWSAGGRLELEARAGAQGGWGTVPPLAGAPADVGPLRAADDTILFYDQVAAVVSAGDTVGALVLRTRAREASSASMQAIMGPSGRLLVGNVDGSLWESDGRRVPGPPPPVTKATGATRYERDGRRSLGVVTPLPSTPWVVLVEVGLDEARRPAVVFLRRMLAVATLLLAIGAWLAWVVARQATAPLERLATHVERVSAGDYSTQASIEAPDEVARLAASFNSMAAHVRERTDELIASRTRLGALVDATTHIVWFADALGDVEPPLPSWQASTGQSDAEVRGAGWRSAIHPDDRAGLEEAWARARLSASGFTTECRIHTRDRGPRLFLLQGVPVRAEDGSVVEWAGTCTDIESQRTAERELRRTENELRQAQKMEAIGRLAGGVAHDFNNLLTSILAPAAFAREQLGAAHPVARELDDIQEAASRAADLTRQLLTFSRQKRLNLGVLDLNEVVADAARLLQRVLGEHVVTHLALDADRPFVRTDAGQVQQVVLNLAINARDAMPEGGHLTIETSNVELGEDFVRSHPSLRAGGYVRLGVSDTGVGMDEPTLERIFEPFFTTKAPGAGTGLGLATVHGIARQAGGHVLARSEPGRGSAFEIYLPVADAPARPTAAPPPRTRTAVGGPELLLLVEDDEAVREAAVRSLRSYGYRVTTTAGGEGALESLARHPEIALVITDMVMPGMSGVELAGRIRERAPRLPILFLSGYVEATATGPDRLTDDEPFLQKPFSPEGLAAAVRDVLGRA